jgi:hypothetical protein
VTRPWVRGGLPFLRSGPLWRVRHEAEPELDRFLAEAAYLRVDLDGRAITSRPTAHATIGASFGFPDWYGNSWDAFDDCLGQWVLEHDGTMPSLGAGSTARVDLDVPALGSGEDFDAPPTGS